MGLTSQGKYKQKCLERGPIQLKILVVWGDDENNTAGELLGDFIIPTLPKLPPILPSLICLVLIPGTLVSGDICVGNYYSTGWGKIIQTNQTLFSKPS